MKIIKVNFLTLYFLLLLFLCGYLKLGIIISIFGILGAIIGANIALNIDVGFLRKAFGVFLAVIAINEIYSIYKRYKKEKRTNTK